MAMTPAERQRLYRQRKRAGASPVVSVESRLRVIEERLTALEGLVSKLVGGRVQVAQAREVAALEALREQIAAVRPRPEPIVVPPPSPQTPRAQPLPGPDYDPDSGSHLYGA